MHFYNASDPVIELYYDSYPFIPSLHPDYSGALGNRMAVIYLNSAPYKEQLIYGNPFNPDSRWSSEALRNIYPLEYPSMWGATSYKELLLRDANGYASTALNFSNIGANKLFVGTYMDDPCPMVSPPPPLTSDSYLTFAFYDESWDNTQYKTYSLVAVDPTKYYFTSDIPQ